MTDGSPPTQAVEIFDAQLENINSQIKVNGYQYRIKASIVATAIFTSNFMFFQAPQKLPKIWATFGHICVAKNFQK